MNQAKPLQTCDRLIAKHGGWWRCGRAATVRSERQQVGHPHQTFRVHLCRHHQRYAEDAAAWVTVLRVVKVYPSHRGPSDISQPKG